jgi:hypothetical protein
VGGSGGQVARRNAWLLYDISWLDSSASWRRQAMANGGWERRLWERRIERRGGLSKRRQYEQKTR